VDRVVLISDKLHFTYSVPRRINLVEAQISSTATKLQNSTIICYKIPRNFQISLEPQTIFRLDQPRHLELALHTGDNEISTCEVRLKPASAGLRLHMVNSKVEGAFSGSLDTNSKPGKLIFKGLNPRESIKVQIPFTVELDLNGLQVSLGILLISISLT
jgi:hypothetical protein